MQFHLDSALPPPSEDETWHALRRVGTLLGLRICWLHHLDYHFSLGGGWTIKARPESAGRLRLDLCEWRRPRATLWTRADDSSRLAEAVLTLREQAEDVREGV